MKSVPFELNIKTQINYILFVNNHLTMTKLAEEITHIYLTAFLRCVVEQVSTMKDSHGEKEKKFFCKKNWLSIC